MKIIINLWFLKDRFIPREDEIQLTYALVVAIINITLNFLLKYSNI